MRYRKQIFRATFFLFLLVCLLTGLAGTVRVPVRAAPQLIYPANSVVISEFRTQGPNGGNDEFIELYNPTASAIDISGWTISGSNNVGNVSTRATLPASTSLPPGQYYLIANTSTNGYSGTVTPNLTYSTGITNDGGIALSNGTTIVDQVGMSSGSAYGEGTRLGTFTSTTGSYERLTGGADGNCLDDNNNVTDFNLIPSSNPQNLSTPPLSPVCGPAPAPTAVPPSLSPTGMPLPTVPPGSVIISEVAWSGTQASPNDEWIELYNTTSNSLVLIGTRLVNSTGSVDIVLDGVIPANGFYLLERARDLTVSDVTATQIYSGALGDTNDTLTLSMWNGTVLDTANSDGGAWPAGTGSPNFNSMERVVTGGVVAADTPAGWVSNTQASTWTRHDAANNLIRGTPGGSNWGFSVTPTLTPTNTLSPTPTLTGTPTSSPTPAGFHSVIISEVGWMGTGNSANDEWIELYNPGSTTISLAGWVLRADDGSPNITFPAGSAIPAKGFFVLERTNDNTISDVTADLIYTGALNDSFEVLRLYPNSSLSPLIDSANVNGGSWPAGSSASATFGSMERVLIGGVPMLDIDGGWITNNNSTTWTKHDARGTTSTNYLIHGTPGYANWASTVTATPSATPTRTVAPTSFRTSTSAPLPPPPLIAINEFLPRPGHDWNNDGIINVGDEYIELLNHGVIDVNLSGYRLDDEANIGSNPYTLPSVTLKPGERIVFYGSQTGLLLSDGGDGVRLLKPNGQLADAYNYSVVRYPDLAFCRIPDNGGADDWNQNCYPTPGMKNSLSGSFLRPPTEIDVNEPLCPVADTLPEDFAEAECRPFGSNIWNRFYWDAKAWFGERILPHIQSKWDVYAD